MSDPVLTFAFELRAVVGVPQEIGDVRGGRRRIVPILGGTVEGAGWRGRIMPGGADWQLIQPDGFSELDTRYTIETEAGSVIYVQNAGIRHAAPGVMRRLLAGEVVDPSLVYFRTVARFETADRELQWLMRAIFIGAGARAPELVTIRFFSVD